MAEQRPSDADIATQALADEVRERKGRAGRLNYITFAVNTQLALTKLSASLKGQMMDAEENYGDYLTPEQKDRLLTARERMLDAADNLHSVAAELVGVLRRDNT
jgi:hypothetical protein